MATSVSRSSESEVHIRESKSENMGLGIDKSARTAVIHQRFVNYQWFCFSSVVFESRMHETVPEKPSYSRLWLGFEIAVQSRCVFKVGLGILSQLRCVFKVISWFRG
jgi:hypothetical protein